MRTNVKTVQRTHEGAPGARLSASQQLRRSVMACLLWEDTFYEDGESIADRIKQLVSKVSFDEAATIAVEARTKFKLRHVPLLIVREIIRNGHGGRKVGDLIYQVIQRPDELGELLAIYWKDNKDQPLTAQMKIGLARAFKKFNEYQLAKWNKDASVTLRDVLFLSHSKPRKDQEDLFKRLANMQLATPDTWEVALSGGADKKETFERLIREEKLGALALLRNLRGMEEAGVDRQLVRQALKSVKTERILPFRFITAANYAPWLGDILEEAMFKCLEGQDKLPGHTALAIDHSGSMVGTKVSKKSELDRFDAASALVMLAKEICESSRIFCFSDNCWEINNALRGFGLREGLKRGRFGSTYLGRAVGQVLNLDKFDRMIVVTDEQSHDTVPIPNCKAYMVNVATYQNGVGYGDWVRISGWSEAIIDYIKIFESGK